MKEDDAQWVGWSDEHEAIFVAIMSQLEELPTYHDRAFTVLNVIRQLATVEASRLVGDNTQMTETVFAGLCKGWSMMTFNIPKMMADEPIFRCGRCPACIANQMNTSGGAATEPQRCMN